MRPTGALRLALRVLLLGAPTYGSGCGLLDPACDPPAFRFAVSAPIPTNVLGFVVRAGVLHADSVGLRFGAAGGALDSTAPAVPPVGDSVVVPALGLMASSVYSVRPVAFARCGRVDGPLLSFTTGQLPADLPSYHASGSNPAPGYVVLAATPYGLVIDNTGRVVWYHRFATGSGLNFEVERNGHYFARPPSSVSTEPARWLEIDPLGNELRTLGCLRGLVPRFHDLLLAPDGSYWMLCDETRTMDLTALGGVPDAQVLGQTIQRVSPDGVLLFEWSPFDHFALTDLPLSERQGRNVNWTHGNALDLAADGNLLVSFRNLGEITKIDTHNGAVLWRMGGLANQFNWENSPAPGFAGQHGLRTLPDREFLVLDNLGGPESHAERFAYDEAARTARLVQSFGEGLGVIAQLGGSTQSLANGRVLVAFGNGGRLIEYGAQGQVVWRIEGDAGYVFRAQRIASLYRPR